MDNNIIVISISVFIAIVVYIFIAQRRHKKKYREQIKPVLEAHGLKYISEKYPGVFKIGPFPKFEVKIGRPQSKFLGISGEYSEYRIITVEDAEENQYEIWAKIEYEIFKIHRIRWRAENPEILPESAKNLFENQL